MASIFDKIKNKVGLRAEKGKKARINKLTPEDVKKLEDIIKDDITRGKMASLKMLDNAIEGEKINKKYAVGILKNCTEVFRNNEINTLVENEIISLWKKIDPKSYNEIIPREKEEYNKIISTINEDAVNVIIKKVEDKVSKIKNIGDYEKMGIEGFYDHLGSANTMNKAISRGDEARPAIVLENMATKIIINSCIISVYLPIYKFGIPYIKYYKREKNTLESTERDALVKYLEALSEEANKYLKHHKVNVNGSGGADNFVQSSHSYSLKHTVRGTIKLFNMRMAKIVAIN